MTTFEKLSSYNVLNYLLPGVLFVVFAAHFTRYSFIQENVVLGVFVYYFVGLVVSRFGSLVLEPVFKRIRLIRYAEYRDFVAASAVDEKLVVMSETNNTYRTLSALILLLGLLRAFQALDDRAQVGTGWSLCILAALLLAMFIFSYRKQTDYIRRRVLHVNEQRRHT